MPTTGIATRDDTYDAASVHLCVIDHLRGSIELPAPPR